MPEEKGVVGRVEVTWNLRIADANNAVPSSEEMDRIGDLVGEDLSSRDDMDLIDIMTDANDGLLSITFAVDVFPNFEPRCNPIPAVRSALHSAEIGTPGWESHTFEIREWAWRGASAGAENLLKA